MSSSSTDHPAHDETMSSLAIDSPSVRIESRALYAALIAGVIGALLAIVLEFLPPLPLFGEWSFGSVAAVACGITVAVATVVAYRRVLSQPGQEWRRPRSPVLNVASFTGVVLVHSLFSVLVTVVGFLVVSLGFRGLVLDLFWSIVLMTTATGLNVWVASLSASHLTTVRLSNMLMRFVALGTLASTVTASDPDWWRIHFSHLGTFGGLSSILFNGTLIVGGLMVTAFALYVSNDMQPLVAAGVLRNRRSPGVVSTMFVIMGVMLAGVGLVPVNVSVLIHNLCASGMAFAFAALLLAGPWILRGMPRAYFVASWLFVAAMILFVFLFTTEFFGLTAFEIVVFALIFGWISVFIRFLATTGAALEGCDVG